MGSTRGQGFRGYDQAPQETFTKLSNPKGYDSEWSRKWLAEIKHIDKGWRERAVYEGMIVSGSGDWMPRLVNREGYPQTKYQPIRAMIRAGYVRIIKMDKRSYLEITEEGKARFKRMKQK